MTMRALHYARKALGMVPGNADANLAVYLGEVVTELERTVEFGDQVQVPAAERHKCCDDPHPIGGVLVGTSEGEEVFTKKHCGNCAAPWVETGT